MPLVFAAASERQINFKYERCKLSRAFFIEKQTSLSLIVACNMHWVMMMLLLCCLTFNQAKLRFLAVFSTFDVLAN
jgi:hypothetical protein